MILQASGISKTYVDGKVHTTVLYDLDLRIDAGEKIAIVGTSGSGKSTLLHILGGLDEPTTGTVLLHGQNLSAMNETKRGIFRNRHLGFVYQFHHLLAEFSATENVAMPLLMRAGVSVNEARDKANHLLNEVGLGHRLSHRPSELSGGERQRVAIARALVLEPSLILADEPTGNLDEDNARAVFELLARLQASKNMALLMVTHDKNLAALADKQLLMRGGRLVC